MTGNILKRSKAKVRQISSGRMDGSIDPNLSLESLPTTIEQYHQQLHGMTNIVSQDNLFGKSKATKWMNTYMMTGKIYGRNNDTGDYKE